MTHDPRPRPQPSLAGSGDLTPSRLLAAGAADSVPVVLGYLSIGFAAGIIERSAGLSVPEIALLSLLLYAGSAQFVVASMIAVAAPASAIVSAVFLVNIRHLLLSAAIAPHFAGLPAWKAAIVGAQLTDETFVVAMNRLTSGWPPRFAWMLGLNVTAYSAWALANIAGGLLGHAVTDIRALGLDFTLFAMFAGLLVLQLAARPRLGIALVAASLAAVVAVAATLVIPGNWGVIIATVVAATAGMAMERAR